MLSIVKSFCVLINFLYLSTDTVSDSAVSLVLYSFILSGILSRYLVSLLPLRLTSLNVVSRRVATTAFIRFRTRWEFAKTQPPLSQIVIHTKRTASVKNAKRDFIELSKENASL